MDNLHGNAERIVRVLLADDHVALRQGLELLIEAEAGMKVVGHADTGAEAIQLACTHQPDVVLMDVSMPDGNGIEATERIRRECPSVRVLGFSRHTDPGYARRLFSAGATGFVVKKISGAELIQALRVVAAGGTYLDSVMTPLMIDETFGRRPATPWKDGALTDREKEVLRWIARGHSNKEIAAELKISVKTVEYHKVRCSAKLQLKSRADIVRYAISQRWLEE